MVPKLRWSWLGTLAFALVPNLVQAQGTESRSHTVRSGDTLWDLAGHYLSDPFLWPDIFRLNTAIVEDPHWIYPGEELRLPGAGTENTASVPATDTPAEGPPAAGGLDSAVTRESATDQTATPPVPAQAEYAGEESDTAPLFPRLGHQMPVEALRSYVDQTYRPLRRSEFYSSGFLTENEKLPFGTVLGPVTPQQIKSVSSRSNATLYTVVGVAAPRGATYQVGDTLLLAQLGGEVAEYGKVVVPTGLAQVIEVGDDGTLASVIAVYGAIRKGQLTLPAEAFAESGTARASPVADGVRGRLLAGKGRQDLKAPQMVVFLDRGRADGVSRGDIFEARRRPARLPDGTLRVEEVMATLQVVHVREHSSTARILNVMSPDLPSGTDVRQVRKLP